MTGWREVGKEAWSEAGVEAPIEPTTLPSIPPWLHSAPVKFKLEAGAHLPPGTSVERRRQEAAHYLASLPQCATWVWTDGSAEGGVLNGGAGALLEWPDGTSLELRAPAGKLCSSFRAELVAMKTALQHLLTQPAHQEDPIVLCTDSQAALAALRSGPAEQRSMLSKTVWEALLGLSDAGRREIHLQWVPSHCGLRGNEQADDLAKQAASLPQEEVPVDVRTVVRAVTRAARTRTVRQRPHGWYRALMEERLPAPVSGHDRFAAVDIHQLRAGHWAGSDQYLHRIGRNPSAECPRCSELACRAGRCTLCREEADTPWHVLLRCPALMRTRFRLTGSIHPDTGEARRDDYIAALGTAKAARLRGSSRREEEQQQQRVGTRRT